MACMTVPKGLNSLFAEPSLRGETAHKSQTHFSIFARETAFCWSQTFSLQASQGCCPHLHTLRLRSPKCAGIQLPSLVPQYEHWSRQTVIVIFWPFYGPLGLGVQPPLLASLWSFSDTSCSFFLDSLFGSPADLPWSPYQGLYRSPSIVALFLLAALSKTS